MSFYIMKYAVERKIEIHSLIVTISTDARQIVKNLLILDCTSEPANKPASCVDRCRIWWKKIR